MEVVKTVLKRQRYGDTHRLALAGHAVGTQFLGMAVELR